jgi:UBX domain-containing protein 11
MKPTDHIYKFKPRTNNLRHLLDDDVLDDETRRMLMKDVLEGGKPRGPVHAVATTASQATGAPASASRHRAVPAPSASPSDAGTNDLLLVMTQRLRSLESQCNVLQKELKEKSSKVIELEDKYRSERTTRKQLEEDVGDLHAQCTEQQRQINEMHVFLSDYGLSWVGGSASTSPTITPPRSPTAKPFDFLSGNFTKDALTKATGTDAEPSAPEVLESTAKPVKIPTSVAGVEKSSKSKLYFDLDCLKRNAAILSEHVGLTGIHAGDQPNSKQIKERDMVYVAVYQDGISVNSGLFRPYGWPLCDAILGDLLEGFYPYEFRDKYPDGFPITIVDKSSEMCPMGTQNANHSVHGIESVNDHGYKPITRESLIKKLPERYVTANGHLIQVRGTMAHMLTGGTAPSVAPATLITADTAAGRAVGDATMGVQPATTSSSTSNVTALQIKLPQGQKIALHMYFHDTIASVRAELEKAAPFFKASHGYELTTAFPRRTYDDHCQTLEALGLVPNGAMMMIKLLPPPT